ncbi:uncharacterized protein A1O5_09276 [Cladophialophora psammophila CBS 110553]|uniref:Uncharacterized protein n=1 Tax=Cladophialophora psammophila CBS 110553 TaxID=1182543 RepID=W9XBW8_9EURO|nr:uncharacterized protein A1O5_09276 [Cladophialophora psammophila CBS 110553]EXJ67929.1 hypothetical protein A1O5_09276 [Cladophialophora psammophila CBS 110553]
MATAQEILQHKTFITLCPPQISSFMTHGFLRLPSAIPKETCESYTKHVCTHLGMDPSDKTTWTKERVNMPKNHMTPWMRCRSRPQSAILSANQSAAKTGSLTGGKVWGDGFIVNLGSAEVECHVVPPKELQEWHVDGDFSVHFLIRTSLGVGKLGFAARGLNALGNGFSEPWNAPRTNFADEILQAPDESFIWMMRREVWRCHPHAATHFAHGGQECAQIDPHHSQFSRPNSRDYSLIELKTIQDVASGDVDKFKD